MLHHHMVLMGVWVYPEQLSSLPMKLQPCVISANLNMDRHSLEKKKKLLKNLSKFPILSIIILFSLLQRTLFPQQKSAQHIVRLFLMRNITPQIQKANVPTM